MPQLPQRAIYALRAMAWLAIAGRAVPSAELAAATSAPPHYLAKVLRRLVAAGLLSSQKGHGGGFRLVQPPDDITLAEVFAAVGFAPDPSGCGFGWAECDVDVPCPLHTIWLRMNDVFATWAAETTLADVDHDQVPDTLAGDAAGA